MIFGLMPDWNPVEMIGYQPNALSYSLYETLITNDAWNARLVPTTELSRRWKRNAKGFEVPKDLQERAILYRSGYEGLLQGSLGRSDKYGESIISLILQRIPISLFFGLYI